MAQRLMAGKRPYLGVTALILLLLTVLSGCGPIPTSSTWRGAPMAGNWVTIQRGDTLGVIARQAGIPLLRLQRFNPGVEARHLAIGERILVPTSNERAPSGGPYRYQVRPGDTYSSIARHFRTTPGRIQTANRGADPGTLRIGQIIQVPLRGTPASSATTAAKPQKRSNPAPVRRSDPGPMSGGTKDWQWPLNDYRIVRHFGADKHGTLQPMLLSTRAGSQARVVADGQVSFASSMRQLGRVVIVHHADNLQTVYALCDVLKVNDGDRIKAGTPVCTVGYSGATQRYDLLFDVRHGGKPIDPRKVLR
ncbi:LysM domain-containing protein [Modicisalibacter ilicicola DSM 19980]|uniref:LysM domain-containing protein n=1 Tax=Modicisalibacter ilicicola DSM 19980 TaxID=1121942 RepID=A0A1M4XA62_9GAMM|nr:LysM peptidoglycan-binding domain-containing protein [Halomonas ilicicola]SHE90301.1 LysM domain-containing protein [Halomonas ilicicola DSM 19980]